MQRVVTRGGWIIPVHVRGKLPYMDMPPPTDYEFNNYNHVAFTSEAAWDPTKLGNQMGLKRIDEYFGARLSDTGEKGTQRIIAKMLMERYDGNRQLSVLNRGDTLDGDGIPRRHTLVMQLDVAHRKKKREDVSTELMQDKEKSTTVPCGYYKLKGDAELEYHFGCVSDCDRKAAVIRMNVYDNISEKFLIRMHKPLGKRLSQLRMWMENF